MKKISKKIGVVVALILAILMIISNIALAKIKLEELDPKSWITLPMFIRNDTTNISVSPNAGTYTLYYQMQFMTDSQFNAMETKQRTFKEELDRKEEILNTKTAELNTVINQYNEEGKNGTVSEATKQALDNARAAQKAAADDYANYAKAAQEELMEIIPDFVETAWKQTTDGTVELDYGGKTGSIHFVLWAKLVASGETTYDMNVYSTSVTGSETVSIGETTLSLKVGESKTLTLSHTGGTKGVIWESSDETIAEVNENGKVTAIREGQAVITVKLADGSSRDTCTVTVTSETGGGSGSQEENPPKGNITIPGANTNKTTGGSTTNTAGNKPTGVTGNMDNTKAGGKIPQTGGNYTIILIVAGFAIAGGFCYYQYRKYNF